MEDAGMFGTLWASFGMTAYFMALVWINVLLGLFISPLFMMLPTWFMKNKKESSE